MLLPLLLLCLSGDVFKITGTNVYQPFCYLTVSDKGEVYLIDSEMNIRRYSSEGRLLGTFAGRGEGPGELMAAFAIDINGETLWAQDTLRRSINLYTLEGKPLQTLFSEEMTHLTHRIDAGWLSVELPRKNGDTGTLTLFDEKLEASRLFFSWTPRWTHSPKIYPIGMQAKRLSINPAKEFNYFRIDRENRFAYIIPSGPVLEIMVIDLVRLRHERTITLEDKPIPFNKNWGKAQIVDNNQRSRTGVLASLDAPPYFPIVRGFGLTHDGHLLIDKWTGMPDDRVEKLLIHPDGSRRDLSDPDKYARIYDVVAGKAYLMGYEDGEAVVYIVPEVAIAEHLADHPIDYEKPKKGAFVLVE